MDNLKTLMDKRDYQLVLKLTNSSHEINDLFYRISAFLALGKPEDALSVIKDNQNILEGDLSLLIKVHIEILCLLNRFDEAKNTLKYYENLPYQSQVVEEALRAAPELIKEEEKKSTSFKYLNDDQIIEKLHSKNNNDILIALDIIKGRDIFAFLNDIYRILLNNQDQLIRSFALLLLVQKELDREVRFNHDGKIIVVNPKKLDPPFIGDEFNAFVKLIQTKFKDASLAENAISILSTYILFIYPDNLSGIDLNVLLGALFVVSKEYMQDPIKDIKEYALLEKIDDLELQEQIEKINRALKEK